MLERVANPHPGELYLVRFTCPEFTTLCPVTGQPDFAHLVIDYVPRRFHRREQVAEALSWRVPQSRRLPRGLHAGDRAGAWSTSSRRNGCASAAIGIRAAACRSTSSIRPARRPQGCGCRTRASRPIAAAAERRAGSRRRSATRRWRSGFDAVGFARAGAGARARAGLAGIPRRAAITATWAGSRRAPTERARPAGLCGPRPERRRARHSITGPPTIRWRLLRAPARRRLGLCARPRLPRPHQVAAEAARRMASPRLRPASSRSSSTPRR